MPRMLEMSLDFTNGCSYAILYTHPKYTVPWCSLDFRVWRLDRRHCLGPCLATPWVSEFRHPYILKSSVIGSFLQLIVQQSGCLGSWQWLHLSYPWYILSHIHLTSYHILLLTKVSDISSEGLFHHTFTGLHNNILSKVPSSYEQPVGLEKSRLKPYTASALHEAHAF